ncbi:MAG: hypothetical protein E7C95_01340 [Anaerococcus prevotii]|uniref:HEPN domain-containing protein n=1 Tax=Anaerococcus prevotii TaxID=33034 RepID=UPI0028FFB254|nr:HEPN domain-containing protein [Anaerococcus prevotii]MDU2557594.1 hypothetical protein [Anaerococcus prevotii]
MSIITEYRFDENFELLGHWFLPEGGINNSITGKLIHDCDGFKDDFFLELYGDFDEISGRTIIVENKLREKINIIGFTSDGKTVVIENAIKIYGTLVSNGFPTSKFLVGRCLVINSLIDINSYKIAKFITDKGIDNIEISSCEFNFTRLKSWIGDINTKKDIGDESASISLALSEDSNDKFYISNKNICLEKILKCDIINNSIRSEYYWKMASIDGSCLNVRQFIDLIKSFKNLIQFFVGQKIGYSYIKLKTNLEGRCNHLVNCYIVTRQFITFSKFSGNYITLKYADIKDQFNEILNNWYLKEDKFINITENYLSNINSFYYSHSTLLNSIRSLEMFHRNFYIEDDAFEDTQINKLKEEIKDFIRSKSNDDKVVSRFCSNIDYDPEKTLSRRIKDLIQNMDEKMKQNFIKKAEKNMSKSIDSFVYKIVSTRNFYTHGDRSNINEKVITDSRDIINYSHLLDQILKYYIYKQLFEINDYVIDKIINGWIKVI